jgi:integrase/recombinase XerD
VSSPAFGDDIQWRACELVVHRQRGRRSEPLPLPVDIGEAITAYLRDGRPGSAQDRSLFVRVKVPRHGLTTGRITQVAAAPARGARQIQVHRLRHSAATLMLRAGGATRGDRPSAAPPGRADDGDVRQGSIATTLRPLARAWPGARS